jgi:hypothetical protein
MPFVRAAYDGSMPHPAPRLRNAYRAGADPGRAGKDRPVTPLFDGELALVTGAGRGIGRAIALELAAAGATGEIWNVNSAAVA